MRQIIKEELRRFSNTPFPPNFYRSSYSKIFYKVRLNVDNYDIVEYDDTFRSLMIKERPADMELGHQRLWFNDDLEKIVVIDLAKNKQVTAFKRKKNCGI